MKYIIASKEVADNKKKVGWMYREQPSDKDDSGWRVFSGEEGQNYADNADNFGIYDATTIIAIDDSIKPFLDSPVGSEFEKDENGEFILVSEL